MNKSFNCQLPSVHITDFKGTLYLRILSRTSSYCNKAQKEGLEIEKNCFVDLKSVVSIGRLTAFYVVLVPMELIPSKPPPCAYVIVLFCTLQKGSTF